LGLNRKEAAAETAEKRTGAAEEAREVGQTREKRTEAPEEPRVTDLTHASAVTSLAPPPLVAHAAACETRATRGGGGGGVGEVEREVEEERGCSEARRLANTRQLENSANTASAGSLLRHCKDNAMRALLRRYQGAIKPVLKLHCSGDCKERA
jgi:hypothetical protein